MRNSTSPAERPAIAPSPSPQAKGGAPNKALYVPTHPRRMSPHMPLLIPSGKRHEVLWFDTPPKVDQALPWGREPFVPWTGSRRLLLGVLQDALRSFFQYCSARSRFGKRAFREAQAWIWAEDQEWLYSFESICSHLQLDADYIRQGLQQHVQETQAGELQKQQPRGSYFSTFRRRPFHLTAGPGSRIARRSQLLPSPQRVKSVKR